MDSKATAVSLNGLIAFLIGIFGGTPLLPEREKGLKP
jgi:hypothetical protein